MSVKAYVLISVTGEKATNVAKALNNIPGVKGAHAVTGPHDVIAFIEAVNLEALGDLILGGVREVRGVNHTLTCVAVDTD